MKTEEKSGDAIIPPTVTCKKDESDLTTLARKDFAEEDGEWVSSKKVINHKTRQVETRIQRQIIMEDGKVIADSGPQITTRTKEDNWTEESENCAKKGLPVNEKSIGLTPIKAKSPSEKISLEVVDQVINEIIETKNTTREAKNERFQYHDESISELTGYDIHQKALVSPNDLITINCDMIDVKKDSDIDTVFRRDELDQPPKGKLIHYSSKSHKVTDKEEVKEVSKIGVDGEITKETVRTHHHEEIDSDEEPDEEQDDETVKQLPVNQPPEVSKEISREIEYSPVTQSVKDKQTHYKNHQHHHRRHLDRHSIYDIGGKADHTNKWIENHFGSSDASQQDVGDTGLNSSSSGSIVDRRGRPRQRVDPVMSQSYDEAYYSRSNTLAGNHSLSNSSKPISIDKLDSSMPSPSPSPPTTTATTPSFPSTGTIPGRGKTDKQLKKRQSTHAGYNKHNEKPVDVVVVSVSSNSASESSVSSYYHDYHHSSEGSLSPSGLLHQRSPLKTAQQCQCGKSPIHSIKNDPPIVNKRWSSYQHLEASSKPINTIYSHKHYIKRDHNQQHNNNNLTIRVKRRVAKEDASVQASLSDEESGYGNCKKTTNYGKSTINAVSIAVDGGDNNNSNVVRPRPIKTYYFGENVEPIDRHTFLNNTLDYNNDSNRSRLSRDQVHLIDSTKPFILDQRDGKISRSLNCLNDERYINGSFDRLVDPPSRTDIFQTRDHGSLSNWKSTLNLRSGGLILRTINKPLTKDQSKDDLCAKSKQKNSNQDGSLNRGTFTRKRIGSVNNLIENRFKWDSVTDQQSTRGLSPIQERKRLINLRNIDLLLNDNMTIKSKQSTRWPEVNSSSHSYQNDYNGINSKYRHRTPVSRTYYFKTH